jgi:MFS family permease
VTQSPSSPPRLTIIQRARAATDGYPRQFWLLFWGILISSSTGSMVWPFMTIYLRERLQLPLTTITLLLTLNGLMGMAATFVAGPLVDRFGRKGPMVISLVGSSAIMFSFSFVDTLVAWAVLIGIMGALNPLYGVGSNAMIADLIEPDRRAGAYSLLRMIANLGVVIGPAIGGFVASVSYLLAFRIAAGASLLFALLILLFVSETAPRRERRGEKADKQQFAGGYGRVFRDRTFISFSVTYVLACMAYSLMMILLSVYAKENFNMPEQRFGLIMSTNALLVVLFQFGVTGITKRYRAFPILAIGSAFYALGVGSVAWGSGFPTFLLSMVVVTVGEMILVPTATTLTADLAPSDLRGRYMSIYSLTWSLGFAVGPVSGGYLNDNVAPVAIWYGGMAMALLATAGFAVLSRVKSRPVPMDA